VNKSKFLKGAFIVAATSMLPLSQAMADGNWSISGWINEGMTYYDDGVGSDIVQTSDNGTTLGSRITLAGDTDLPNSGLSAGFEVILEPQSQNTPLIFSNQDGGGLSAVHLSVPGTNGGAFDQDVRDQIFVLGSSVHISGGFGKVTVGQQSMPTDNIAVLEDPSLTLWSGISPVFRGNGFAVRGLTGTAATSGLLGAAGATTNTSALWGDFLSCYTDNGLVSGAGIGIDCNGTYQQGIRYDLPTFIQGVSIAVGYSNDDVYDVSGKWKGTLGGLNASVALGFADNHDGGLSVGATNGSDNFQMQAGLMDPNSGIFGSIAYQRETASGVTTATNAAGGNIQDSTDAYWIKVGIKKAFNSFGDTSLSFDYGSYNDQYGSTVAAIGVTGSEVQRLGVAVDQYFGSRLIIYGKWEQLDLDVDQSAASITAGNSFQGAQELDTFTLGTTFFF
jgi:hypothetical protein